MSKLSGRVERLERAAEPAGDKVEFTVKIADLPPGELVRVEQVKKDGRRILISQVYEENHEQLEA